MPKAWTKDKIGAIVEDYFAMLRHELEGRTYVKVAHRRRLLREVSRSEGSIEFKHANISAVMELLGLPYINGYQPRRNYQKALVEALERYLRDKSDLHHLMAGTRTNTAGEGEPLLHQRVPDSANFIYKEAPALGSLPEIPQAVRQIIRRFEPAAERDARNRRLGKAGEELVFKAEQNRLADLKRSDLADKVRWVARDEGDGFGYDVLSFSVTGPRAREERLLEVKTTTGGAQTPFFLTSNELEVSKEHKSHFRIVRLYDFQREPRTFRLRPPLKQHVHLSPTIYRAVFGQVRRGRASA